MTPELEARNLLEELGIEKLPIVPGAICQRLEIDYLEEEFRSIDGVLIIDTGGRILIGVNSLIKEEGRKNFTCAHELAHLCLDSETRSQFYCCREDIESFQPKIQTMELRANKFAAEFLMPQFLYQYLVKEHPPGWDSIKDMAAMSRTSLTATARRFLDLTDHACALIVSEKRVISWFHPSKEFRAYIETGIVASGTIASQAFRGHIVPDSFEVVKANLWLSGRGIKPHSEILEWSLPINSYGEVLTLLFDEEGFAGWVEDGYGDDEDEVEWEPPTFHKSKRKK